MTARRTRRVEVDVRVGPVGRAAQKVGEEVRRTRQVGAPPVDAELDARPRISRSVVEVDRVRIQPKARLEAELLQQSRDVSSRRLLGRIVTGAGDQHGLAPRAGGGDQTPRLREVGPLPLSGGARSRGVRAGGPVAGDSRRQDLARRPPELRPAPEPEKLLAVDCEVQRAPYPNVVERSEASCGARRSTSTARQTDARGSRSASRSRAAAPAEAAPTRSRLSPTRRRTSPRTASRPKVYSKRSGYPAGCASADHSWKYGLRTSTSLRFGT